MTDKNDLREALGAFHDGSLERARMLAAGVAEADSGNAAAHHLLGLIDCRSGLLENGVAHLRWASELDSANLTFRVMLVRALVDSGRGEEALAIAARPSGKDGSISALWHARGEAADCARDFVASAEAWLKVAEFNPSDWRAWGNAGQALAGLERWREAAAALRSAARLNPGEAPIRRNLVTALVQCKQLVEARQEAEMLLTADAGDTVARMLLAKILSDMGNHQQSLEQYNEGVRQALAKAGRTGDRLLELGRHSLSGSGVTGADVLDLAILRALAQLLERTNRMDELEALLGAAEAVGVDQCEFASARAAIALRGGEPALAKRLIEGETGVGDPGQLHRLKAKIEDALGNASAAFAEAEAMNRSAGDYAGWRRRGADYRARLRAMSRDPVARGRVITPARSGHRRSPAFLVGFPRSGTTLLDTFLMGHPGTQVLEEVHMLGAAERSFGNAARVDRYTPSELERARNSYFAELDRHVDPEFAGLVVDKLPLNMLGLPLIYALFPDARIIFAQRHPADCALSCFMQNFVLNEAMASFLDIADSADLYDAAMDRFRFTRSILPLAFHDLVYEELVVDPEAAMKPLIDFLGLDWREELLDHRSTAASRGAIITPSYDQVVKPLSGEPSGRWRRYEAELAPVLPVLLPWAERLGYGNPVGVDSQ